MIIIVLIQICVKGGNAMERKDNAYQDKYKHYDDYYDRVLNSGAVVLHMIFYIAVFFVFKYIGTIRLAISLIILSVVAIAADILAKLYIKREKIDTNLISVIAWSNLFTWIIPIWGVFTGFATLRFTEHPQFKGEKKYKTLAIVGIVLAVLSVIAPELIRFLNNLS